MKHVLHSLALTALAAIAGTTDTARAQINVSFPGTGCAPTQVTNLTPTGLPTIPNPLFGYLLTSGQPMASSTLLFGAPGAAVPIPFAPVGFTCTLDMLNPVAFSLPIPILGPNIGLINIPIPPTAVPGTGFDVQATTLHTNGTVSTSIRWFFST